MFRKEKNLWQKMKEAFSSKNREISVESEIDKEIEKGELEEDLGLLGEADEEW